MGTITVTNIGKAYKHYNTRWSRLREWLTPSSVMFHEKKWVLRDINFTVKRGEAVGVIGVNGAGKSTLLKIIAGTTQPTTGSINVSGRISALLELGMGFHPDFTGRQNAYTSAQILGLTAEQIESVMPEIEAFANIGSYIDQPVRIYSSGMQVRVAFAAATAVRPDILIVDEALSVGDAAFQRKCHRRIESFINDGTALLFVSHDIEGIKKVCERALFIDGGELVASGPSKQVCDQYENLLFAGKRVIGKSASGSQNLTPSDPVAEKAAFDPTLLDSKEVAYGIGSAEIDQVWLEDKVGRKVNILPSGEEFSVCYTVIFGEDTENAVVAMLIKTLEGIALYGTDNVSLEHSLPENLSGKKILMRFRMKCHLAEGTYFLNCGIRDGHDAGVFYHRRVDALMFKVRKFHDLGQAGLVNLEAKFSLEQA